MKKPVLKAYYGGIFFEFVLQDRNADVVIILPGFPGRNDYNEIIEVFFERGYHVFVPRYRGSYQSSGTFLSKSPVHDLEHLTSFVKRAYKNCYRLSFDNLRNRAMKFKDINPVNYIHGLIDFPVLVLHDPNDKVVAFRHTKEMLTNLNKATYIEHYLGHGLNEHLINAFWKEIDKFIKLNYI